MIAVNNLRGRLWSQPGQRLLINGAAGGVGSIALQMAKAHGAHVVGVDHAAKLDLMRTLGADDVVDYTHEDVTRRGERYDLIVDVASTLRLADCERILTPDGAYVVIGHDHYGRRGRRTLGSLPQMFALMARSLVDRHVPKPWFEPLPKREAMAVLCELLAAGTLTPVVGATFPLAEVAAAFAALEDATLCGRVVVVP